jgi:hypothetical protein
MGRSRAGDGLRRSVPAPIGWAQRPSGGRTRELAWTSRPTPPPGQGVSSQTAQNQPNRPGRTQRRTPARRRPAPPPRRPPDPGTWEAGSLHRLHHPRTRPGSMNRVRPRYRSRRGPGLPSPPRSRCGKGRSMPPGATPVREPRRNRMATRPSRLLGRPSRLLGRPSPVRARRGRPGGGTSRLGARRSGPVARRSGPVARRSGPVARPTWHRGSPRRSLANRGPEPRRSRRPPTIPPSAGRRPPPIATWDQGRRHPLHLRVGSAPTRRAATGASDTRRGKQPLQTRRPMDAPPLPQTRRPTHFPRLLQALPRLQAQPLLQAQRRLHARRAPRTSPPRATPPASARSSRRTGRWDPLPNRPTGRTSPRTAFRHLRRPPPAGWSV